MSRATLAVLAAVVLSASSASAGALGEFERHASHREGRHDRGRDRRDHGRRDPGAYKPASGGEGYAAAGDAAALALFVGGANSRRRVDPSSDPSEARDDGEALIPFARGDAAYQFVRGGPSAADLSAEGGYAWGAIGVRHTEYWDRRSDETLRSTSVDALYRMSFGAHFELDLGYGAYFLDGKVHHAGNSFTLPIRIAPNDFFGVEFRPSWHFIGAGAIRDHTVSLRLGRRFAWLNAGYRWVESGPASLDGPEVGLTFAW